MTDDLVKRLRVKSNHPESDFAEAADAIERLTRERDEARAYLKAFVYATIDPADKRHDAQLHKANPSLGWVFMLEHEHVCKSRSVLSSQVRRAMEIVGYDKLKIEPPGTTVADDLVEANRAKCAAEARIAKLEADNARLREALATARAWHESEDKALSKSGRSDLDYHWRRGGHKDQIADIRQVLPDEEYNEAWDRINARTALENTHADK